MLCAHAHLYIQSIVAFIPLVCSKCGLISVVSFLLTRIRPWSVKLGCEHQDNANMLLAGTIDTIGKLHVYIHAYTHARTHRYMRTCMHAYIHPSIQTNIHTYIAWTDEDEH